jgi:hypothetical protein
MPVLTRICTHLENNCMQLFAKSLGLDEKKYQNENKEDVETEMQEIWVNNVKKGRRKTC